ncbi:DNA polymerase III subunit gamma/tau [Butyrivibrio sp. AE3004]|uniref:DNA polymerase III subunit gamma/tau n=1 Tax=Butyrivibrio sp. AE3004 TaxID=1506994 RepID=UPI0009DC9CD3|nr:DNA polymerase III subunit gamma/tau [Butyrivibrio sp. AE3004]
MAYVALYRKFRPPVFDDVKGQDHIVTTLKNQIKSDRIGHAYLFCGTRGTGKTSVAKILARAVNCENPQDGSPCGECPTCKAIESGAAMGNVIEIDAASNNGVDNIREIIDEISYSPTVGKYKVYIIDEVHMLSTGAFNALLKSLEEPPSYVIFILATTEVQKIPITILSRCQRYDFHRITIDTIADRLREVVTKEGIQVEEKALRYVAKAADGSMRDSLSLLDQCIAFNYGEELTYDRVLGVLGAVDTEIFGRLFSHLIKQDVTGALNLLSEIVIQGRELSQFVNDFIWYLRNLMLVSTSDNMEDAVDMSTDNLKILKELAKESDVETIMRYIRVFSELSQSLRYAPQKRILIEVALIRLCKPQMEEGSDALLDRIRILEDKSKELDGVIGGIKSGQITVGAAGTTAGNTTGDIQGKDAGPAKAKVLESAVAEDVKKVVNNWGRILVKMGMPMRVYMEKAILSQGNDNKLFIVLDNKERVLKYNEDPGKSELSAVLDEAIGKHIDFEMRYADNERPVEEQYVSLNNIQFDIVVEEEEEMPELPLELQTKDTEVSEVDATETENHENSEIYDGESDALEIENSGGDIITGFDDDYEMQEAMDAAYEASRMAAEYDEGNIPEDAYNDQQAMDEENAFEEKDHDED